MQFDCNSKALWYIPWSPIGELALYWSLNIKSYHLHFFILYNQLVLLLATVFILHIWVNHRSGPSQPGVKLLTDKTASKTLKYNALGWILQPVSAIGRGSNLCIPNKQTLSNLLVVKPNLLYIQTRQNSQWTYCSNSHHHLPLDPVF